MKKISIVVSVYNEEEVINKFYTELKKQANDFIWDYEVIFVNDGSEDRSRVILQELVTDKKVKVINFSRNFGHEAAMIAGIDNASANSFKVSVGGILTGASRSTSTFFTGSGLIKAPGPVFFFFCSC